MSEATQAGQREPAILAIAAGVGLLCVGMALTIAGVVVPGLFLPGVVLVAAGMLACAAAAVLRLLRPAEPDRTPRRA